MHKASFLILCHIALFIPDSYAQQIWTLQDCIDYAIAHSLTVKRQNNVVKTTALELNTAKNAFFPTLTGSSYQDFSFGRGLSAENTYTSTDVRTTTFAVVAELPIFTGFRISNTVKLKQHLYNASIMDLQKAEDELQINVIKAYQNVLYKMEEVAITYRQYHIDSLQSERLRTLVAKGKVSKVELARQISAESQSKTKNVQAGNAVKMSLLTLSQLMELPTPEMLHLSLYSISVENTYIEKPETVFENAITSKAEIKAEEHRVKAFERQINISRSSLFPMLSLTGGFGTKCYFVSNSYNETFGRQVRNNISEYVTLNLTIPIFNRFETRNDIRKSKVELYNQHLVLEEKKKDLYKAIQQAYYTALDAQSNYIACKESSKSAEESLRLVIAKYENGLADITEYNEAMNTYSESVSKLTQSKYEFFFAVEILKFYKGN